MSEFTEQIASTRDRITRMLERSATPSAWENLRAGLSGTFGTGKFANELNTRVGPEAELKRQGTMLDLLRGMQQDEMAQKEFGLKERRTAATEMTARSGERNSVAAMIRAAAEAGNADARATDDALKLLIKDEDGRAAVAQYMHDTPGYEKTGVQNATQMVAKAIQESNYKPSGGGPFSGTGIDASTYNLMLSYNDKRAKNEPTTEADDRAYALAVQRFLAPTQFTDPQTGAVTIHKPSLPEGFVVPGGGGQATPPSGGTTQPISPPKTQTISEAARMAMPAEGLRALDEIDAAIWDGPDNPNRTTLLLMAGNVPGTTGRMLRAKMNTVLSNIVYLKSGAQAGEKEVNEAKTQYMISPADNAATIKDKLARARAYFESVQGNRAGEQTQVTTPAAGAPVRVNTKAERDALAPGTRYIGPDGIEAVR